MVYFLKFMNRMKIGILFPAFIFFLNVKSFSQNGSLAGKITDAETKEELIGATVVIQGTTKGAITDFEGNYMLENISPGKYNIVISYISYNQQISQVEIVAGQTYKLDVMLKPATIGLDEVVVKKIRRRDTEISLLNTIKTSNVVSNGISAQQISHSQDKDASEVLKRVPGISIREGKFIIVRGLTERYNTVWLNNTSAPSSEVDKRAFSFDIIPSDMIDNILIYKTPAPELPANFAGAVINIQTKNLVDEGKITFSYTPGFQQGTTFHEFYQYQGSNTDWLGFDNNKRMLPAGFPSTTKEFRQLAASDDIADKQKIMDLGRSFENIWTPDKRTARPDESFLISSQKRFTLGKISIANINSLTYSNTLNYDRIYRAAYNQFYDYVHFKPAFSYEFNDDRYVNNVRIGGLSNWIFIFGKNQKIEFRNLLNQFGSTRTTLRDGTNYYGDNLERAYELAYESRTTYTGQIAGDHKFNHDLTHINYTIGYAYADKLQPDTRRIKTSKNNDAGELAPYSIGVTFNADPTLLGRLFLTNHEHIYTINTNFTQIIPIDNFLPQLNTGFYYEYKARSFVARDIGYVMAGPAFNLYTHLPADTNEIFSPIVFNAIDTFFKPQNINSTNGLKIDESTNPSEVYDASNRLIAAYLGIKIPIGQIVNFYPGVRLEKNQQILNGYNEIGDTVHIVNDKLDVFPSVNLSVNITKKYVVRMAYGKTINRPEFREIAPYSYYDFEEKATIYGNETLKNAYIKNYDLRLEWYPSSGEIISFGGFYKDFTNPIEAHLKDFGTGYNFKYFNALKAKTYGLELDIRKHFAELAEISYVTRFLKDFTIVANASIIKSSIENNDPTERDSVRNLQGQSPYLINFGLFYQNDSIGISASLMYNRIGERIAFVGDKNNPHIYEMPFNSLDLTLDYKISKKLTFKAGIKNILNDAIIFQQHEDVMKDTNGDKIGDQPVRVEEINRKYKPGRLFKVGFSLNF